MSWPFRKREFSRYHNKCKYERCPLLWEGNAYTLNSGDKAGSDLDIIFPIVQSGKAKFQGQEMPVFSAKRVCLECYGFLNC